MVDQCLPALYPKEQVDIHGPFSRAVLRPCSSGGMLNPVDKLFRKSRRGSPQAYFELFATLRGAVALEGSCFAFSTLNALPAAPLYPWFW
jgi:hypothetical protein